MKNIAKMINDMSPEDRNELRSKAMLDEATASANLATPHQTLQGKDGEIIKKIKECLFEESRAYSKAQERRLLNFIQKYGEERYEEGKIKGYEEESIGCYNHCEQARQEERQKLVEKINRLDTYKLKDSNGFWYTNTEVIDKTKVLALLTNNK